MSEKPELRALVQNPFPARPQALSIPQDTLAQMGLATLVPAFLSSFDLTTDEGMMLLAECVDGEAGQISVFLNVELEVVHWYVASASKVNDRTGEERQYPRTVLILADGSLVQAGSKGIARSVLMRHYGGNPAPWNPPLKVIPRSRPLDNGEHWYSLQIVKGTATLVEPTAERKRK